MCVCVCVCVWCVCVCVCVCEHMYSCILTFTHVSLAHILTYICTLVCVVCVCGVCVCVCVFVYGCHILVPFTAPLGVPSPRLLALSSSSVNVM